MQQLIVDLSFGVESCVEGVTLMGLIIESFILSLLRKREERGLSRTDERKKMMTNFAVAAFRRGGVGGLL